MIEVKGLTKVYKDIRAVDNLTLNINDNELFSLLGVNGAGKTTTIKLLTCLIKSTSGDAILNGFSINKESDKIKEIISISPQETAVAGNLTVRENLEFMASIYRIGDVKNKVEDTINLFKLNKVANKKSNKLSGGYMRRLSIAMAIITNPKILFLDEPTLGLDVIARRELWDIINNLKKNKTIILTTHYMEEAEMLSNRIGIMRDGRLIKVGTSDELIKSVKAINFEDAFVKIVREE